MPEQIVAQSKEEAAELCVNHFRSYELLAFNPTPATQPSDVDKYANICSSLLRQYAELKGIHSMLEAHKSFTSTH